ncbi:MAG: hypothetical protein [Bacteriophage sp.]|nr:MAG: hypothetical protein [Bacteriophage sp.]
MKKDNICFEYEQLFGLPHSVGGLVLEDLLKKFSHANGEFVADDNGGRTTAFNLGQASVIKYIVNQLNIAKQRATEVND